MAAAISSRVAVLVVVVVVGGGRPMAERPRTLMSLDEEKEADEARAMLGKGLEDRRGRRKAGIRCVPHRRCESYAGKTTTTWMDGWRDDWIIFIWRKSIPDTST